MVELSRITEKFSESVIREMTRICDAAGGINLSQGFPDFDCCGAIKEAAIQAIKNNNNQYPVTFGEPELRQAICRKAASFNKMEYDSGDEVTVTCGATEAMLATLKAVINPGDEIIIFEPYYENYGPDVILCGAIPRYIKLQQPEWNYDKDELSRLFNTKTKAIIINTPNNPSGKVFSKQELEEIAALCIEWDALAITDEIYEHIIYDGEEHVSIASLPGMRDRTVTINSLSKTYSVTGWRVGWALAHSLITARIRKVHDFLTVGAPTPFQCAGAVALGFDAEYYKKLGDFYCKNRQLLYDVLSRAGFEPVRPTGAYYIMANIHRLKEKFDVVDDVAFSRKLIEFTGVATVPGSAFYANPNDGLNYVRFTFCKTRETLQEVGKRFRQFFPT